MQPFPVNLPSSRSRRCYLCSPASSRPTSSATLALYRNSREPRSLSRPGKNGWWLFKDDATFFPSLLLPCQGGSEESSVGSDWQTIDSCLRTRRNRQSVVVDNNRISRDLETKFHTFRNSHRKGKPFEANRS